MFIEYKQKRKRNKSSTELSQPTQFGSCNFLQKHSDTKLGQLISSKKIKRATKHGKIGLDSEECSCSISKSGSATKVAQNSPNRHNSAAAIFAEKQRHKIIKRNLVK